MRRKRQNMPRPSPGAGSFAHLPAGQLEEHVLEIRAAMHEAQVGRGAQVLDRALRIAQVAERRLAVELGAIAEVSRALAVPGFRAVAVDLDDFGLDVLGD